MANLTHKLKNEKTVRRIIVHRNVYCSLEKINFRLGMCRRDVDRTTSANNNRNVAASFGLEDIPGIMEFFNGLFLVALILGIVNVVLIPCGDRLARIGYIGATFWSLIIGTIVCGLGTSVYSARNKDSDDMTVRKALFCVTVRPNF